MRVIIIGGGIIGAAIAHGLRDADVTVLEAGAGATAASFGWIGASYYLDAAHHRLRAEGLHAWARLLRDVDLPVIWCGTLSWEGMDAAEMRGFGYQVEEIDAVQFAHLEPGIARRPAAALRFEAELAAEPGAVAARLLSQARVVTGLRAEAIETTAGRVSGVRTDQGVMPADCVVVAAGTGTAALLAPLGVPMPMHTRPGLMVRTAPVAARLTHICVAPNQELRQLPDGTLLAPTAASHQADRAERLEARPDTLAAACAARLGDLLGEDVRWRQVMRADRPMPGDELPVIGAAGPDGLHVAVMHSGVTLAAITAEIVGAEARGAVLTNQLGDLVAPYRPGRFKAMS